MRIAVKQLTENQSKRPFDKARTFRKVATTDMEVYFFVNEHSDGSISYNYDSDYNVPIKTFARIGHPPLKTKFGYSVSHDFHSDRMDDFIEIKGFHVSKTQQYKLSENSHSVMKAVIPMGSYYYEDTNQIVTDTLLCQGIVAKQSMTLPFFSNKRITNWEEIRKAGENLVSTVNEPKSQDDTEYRSLHEWSLTDKQIADKNSARHYGTKIQKSIINDKLTQDEIINKDLKRLERTFFPYKDVIIPKSNEVTKEISEDVICVLESLSKGGVGSSNRIGQGIVYNEIFTHGNNFEYVYNKYNEPTKILIEETNSPVVIEENSITVVEGKIIIPGAEPKTLPTDIYKGEMREILIKDMYPANLNTSDIISSVNTQLSEMTPQAVREEKEEWFAPAVKVYQLPVKLDKEDESQKLVGPAPTEPEQKKSIFARIKDFFKYNK